MLLTNVWDALSWFVENFFNILLFISLVIAALQSWRIARGNFWDKLKETVGVLINEVEAMPDFKQGEGALKKDYVIDKILEKFGSKFSFISRKRLEKIIDAIVTKLNTFSELN